MFQTYPKWKYSAKTALVVENEEEENGLVGDWFDTPTLLQDHLDLKAKQIDDEQRALRLAGSAGGTTGDGGTPPSERERLKEAADKLGLDYPANISSVKLEALIKAKIESSGE